VIAFASLILGLVTGVVPVTVLVNQVASVEFVLDGSPVGRRASPPWMVSVDFGRDFEPHELVARAFDEKGEEIASVRQWVNLPRPPAEVVLLPERDSQGRVVAARVSWQSILGAEPESVRVTFDRRPLAIEGGRVAIPEFDAATTHILTAELEFPMNVRTRQDMVLGGGSAGDATSELTAVPVKVAKGRLPSLEKLQGWLVKKGQALEITAVEHGPADVLFVRDLRTAEAAHRLARPTGIPAGPGGSRYEMRLAGEDRAQIVWPVARRFGGSSGVLSELFDRSREYRPSDIGVHWLLTNLYHPGTDDPPRRFADAVAVAGLQAFSGYSRRAVVLFLGSSDHERDVSRYSPEMVRRYLGEIHVPLHVWSVEKPAGSPDRSAWGDREDVSSFGKLRNAVGRLKDDLNSQWVLWVAGRHLPQQIELSQEARGVEMAR
jgi:hypothetical protein